MKKYMIGFVIMLSVLVGQYKYEFFLQSDDNLKLAGEENYKIIKTELDKMHAEYASKIDLDNYWKEKYSEKVYTGSSFKGNASKGNAYTKAVLIYIQVCVS